MLRLWRFDELPFMHDEFSALFCTQYESFMDLIRKGVMVDSHPAGVQVFLYYWVKLAGFNEFWIKLPFTIAGIASVYLIYKIAKQWFNKEVGLLASAFFATAQFAIFFSQIARPYSAGLFFTLLFTVYWNQFVFNKEKVKTATAIGFIVSLFLATQMHIFSLAQVGLIYLTGLFIVDKTHIKQYLLAGLASLILYAPTFPIFILQMKDGGIGGWFGKPENDFFFRFFSYAFHYYSFYLIFFVLLIVLPFILDKVVLRKKDNNLRLIGLLWFAIPAAIAYLYSIIRIPVIQFSTLYFCFPFLIIVLFSFYEEKTFSAKQNIFVIGFFLFFGTSSLIYNRQHYDLMYKQGFDQIAYEMKQAQRQHADSISFFIYGATPKMAAFYIDKEKVTDVSYFSGKSDVQDFVEKVRHATTPYIGFGWTDYCDFKWEMAALSAYPYVLKQQAFPNSNFMLLSKHTVCNANFLLDTIYVSKDISIYTNNLYSPASLIICDSLSDCFALAASFRSKDSISNIHLIVEIRDKESDSLLLWLSSFNKDFVFAPNETHTLVNGLRFSDQKIDSQDVKIRFYIWNREEKPYLLESITKYETSFPQIQLGLFRLL